MRARVPQDVDLEDCLVYGLSPIRFGYLVIAVLGTMSLWRMDALPAGLRAAPCLLLLGAGAALAWGRWRGRAADRWLMDLAVHVRRNYRLGSPRSSVRREAPVRLHSIRAIASDGPRAAPP
jgi:hypothetical protein